MPSAGRPSPEYAEASAAQGNVPPLLDRSLAAVRRLADLAGDCATRDGRWLAQNPVSGFLDMEDPPRQTRPARSSQRHPRTDPPHKPGEADMGCSAEPMASF